MSTPETPDTRNKDVDVTHLLDLELLRAEMVNCLFRANELFQQHNQGLQTSLMLGRVADMAVMFTMFSNQGEPRLYQFRVVNPDGTQAHLTKLDADNNALDLDPFDHGFIGAISKSLGPTVAASYHHMVKEPVPPTHPGVNTLQ